ncbi:hypothetical protein [Uliginosibacterium sp. 31-12]|uniref:hypothetical protein n=1 Tax=Uliginosibacterium sp. 31-12 TaxID=3062781 RepID=UPI0026E13CAF|nr:hypothetical protein [Uliginosibacterium sp. 31-12]MDO6388453.1 hypothetical protein [Uliginosibacterium sp. 31-12]
MKRRIFIALIACLSISIAQADSWSYAKKIDVENFTYGKTRIVLTTDSRKSPKYPDFLLEIFTNGKPVARIPGVHFEKLFASKDNRLFVGLSNRGIPSSAAIVFSDTGKITLLVQHGLAEFDYCSKSVTLERLWFDENNPSVRFQIGEMEPKPGIYLRSCDGKEIELAKTVQNAYAKAAKDSR